MIFNRVSTSSASLHRRVHYAVKLVDAVQEYSMNRSYSLSSKRHSHRSKIRILKGGCERVEDSTSSMFLICQSAYKKCNPLSEWLSVEIHSTGSLLQSLRNLRCRCDIYLWSAVSWSILPLEQLSHHWKKFWTRQSVDYNLILCLRIRNKTPNFFTGKTLERCFIRNNLVLIKSEHKLWPWSKSN